MPFEKVLGVVLNVRKKYAETQTTWYTVYVSGYSDVYYEDEITLVQEI